MKRSQTKSVFASELKTGLRGVWPAASVFSTLPEAVSTTQTWPAGPAQVTNSRAPSGDNTNPEGSPGSARRLVIWRWPVLKTSTCLAAAQAM